MNDPLLLSEPLGVTLPQGRHVTLRRVRPEDKERLRAGLAELSPQSTYQRFFTSKMHFSDRALRYLTEVDGVDHAALGAIDGDALPGTDDQAREGLGVARYIRMKSDARVAEAAVAVLDAHQGQGIGSLLLVALSLVAARNGIDTFEAYLTNENRGFAGHLAGLGARARRSTSGLVEVRFPVYPGPADLPDTPAGRKHRAAYDALFAAAEAAR